MKFSNYLHEVPHVQFDDGDDDYFDLELETKTSEQKRLVAMLQDILNGKKVKDKYGFTIQLQTKNEKKKFVVALKDNPTFKSYLKYKFKDVKSDVEKITKTKFERYNRTI